MLHDSLYNVLLVDQTATLDEIKVAFKRRALQVHPDKGGSKEAFHLVYQALETLADPDARKKYDRSLVTGTSAPAKQPCQARKKGKKPKAARSTENRSECRKKRRTGERCAKKTMPKAQQSRETRLLTKVCELLKQLPRDVRSDVIAKEFSQKQRLILEKWMTERSPSSQEEPLQLAESQTTTVRSTIELPQTPQDDGWRRALALRAVHASSRMDISTSASSPAETSQRPFASRKRKKHQKEPREKERSKSGFLTKQGRTSYLPGICFDAMEIRTRCCDLQTGLEYLVVLTTVKQKMQTSQASSECFEQRLTAALTSSAEEQGKELADLKLVFFVLQSAGVFLGSRLTFRTPQVRSVEEFGKIRKLLEPLRQYATNRGRASLYSRFSPTRLKEGWDHFQQAVAGAWKIAGADSTFILNTICNLYEARTEFRNTQLEQWERRCMTMQDKNRHRPCNLRETNPLAALESWERQQMALEDKNKHRPWRCQKRNVYANLERWERQQMAVEDKNKHRPKKLRARLNMQRASSDKTSRKVVALKKLIGRWERLLKQQARLVEKERKRLLLELKAKRKRAEEEQKRLDQFKKTQLREERLRRETLRQKMKQDLSMDDILGHRGDMCQEKRKGVAALTSWAILITGIL